MPRLRRPLLLEVEVEVEPELFWRMARRSPAWGCATGAHTARVARKVTRAKEERMFGRRGERMWVGCRSGGA